MFYYETSESKSLIEVNFKVTNNHVIILWYK
jgi:hypothetical protein